MNHNSIQDSYILQISEIIENVHAAFSNLPFEDFNFKLNRQKWSIGECLDHLIVTGERYLERISNEVDSAKKKKIFSDTIYKPRFIQRKFIKFLEPPYKLKVKTFSVFEPGSNLNKEKILTEFGMLQNKLINQIRETKGLDLKKIFIISPVSRFVKLEIGEAFYLLIVHERRHIWQAKQILPKLRHL